MGGMQRRVNAKSRDHGQRRAQTTGGAPHRLSDVLPFESRLRGGENIHSQPRQTLEGLPRVTDGFRGRPLPRAACFLHEGSVPLGIAWKMLTDAAIAVKQGALNLELFQFEGGRNKISRQHNVIPSKAGIQGRDEPSRPKRGQKPATSGSPLSRG
jgi:hypothetical protein